MTEGEMTRRRSTAARLLLVFPLLALVTVSAADARNRPRIDTISRQTPSRVAHLDAAQGQSHSAIWPP